MSHNPESANVEHTTKKAIDVPDYVMVRDLIRQRRDNPEEPWRAVHIPVGRTE